MASVMHRHKINSLSELCSLVLSTKSIFGISSFLLRCIAADDIIPKWMKSFGTVIPWAYFIIDSSEWIIWSDFVCAYNEVTKKRSEMKLFFVHLSAWMIEHMNSWICKTDNQSQFVFNRNHRNPTKEKHCFLRERETEKIKYRMKTSFFFLMFWLIFIFYSKLCCSFIWIHFTSMVHSMWWCDCFVSYVFLFFFLFCSCLLLSVEITWIYVTDFHQ